MTLPMKNYNVKFAVEKYPRKTMITIKACAGNAGMTILTEEQIACSET